MSRLLRRRPRGAHRAVRPGPFPMRPPIDPWAAYPLFLHAGDRWRS